MQGKGLRTRYIISFIGILAVLIALVSNFFLRSKKTTITNLSINKHQVMKKLFLCSSFADVASLLPQFAEGGLKDKTVAFIPTASIHEDYKQYVEDGRKALKNYGLIVNELEITQVSKEDITRILSRCDYIYITGGNTFFLIQELRKKGIDTLLVQLVNDGKPYIGESAGAMIMAPDIKYAQDMDDHLAHTPHFEDFGVLHTVDFYPVPHYQSYPFEEVTQGIMRKYKHIKLIPITNEQAIEVKGEEGRVISRK